MISYFFLEKQTKICIQCIKFFMFLTKELYSRESANYRDINFSCFIQNKFLSPNNCLFTYYYLNFRPVSCVPYSSHFRTAYFYTYNSLLFVMCVLTYHMYQEHKQHPSSSSSYTRIIFINKKNLETYSVHCRWPQKWSLFICITYYNK